MKVLAVKLTDLEKDIRALWREFENLKPGEMILGCKTKKQFCKVHLYRTPRAVRYMLNGGNPVSNRAGETVSPRSDRIIEDAWTIVSSLSSEQFMTVMPALVERLRHRPLRNAEEIRTVAAIDNAAQDAIERLSTLREQLKPFVIIQKVA